MAGDPIDWSIVVNGAWNRAILTPAGIAKRLFQLEPNTPIEESDALFVAKYEPVFGMTIAQARTALGVRGVEDIAREGAIWAGRHVG